MSKLSDSELEALAKDLSSPAYHGYLQQPLPCPLDERVEALTEAFLAGDDPERRRIIATFGKEQAFVLVVFAERMAILGLRTGSRDRLLKGLVALAIEGFNLDWQETLPPLSLLNHSAEKIGADAAALLEEVARHSPYHAARQFWNFAERTPKEKAIEAMGFSLQSTTEGPTYVRNW